MSKPPPKVRVARPKGRNIELRYICAIEKREVRLSTKTRDDEDSVAEQKADLEAELRVGVDAEPRRRSKDGPYMASEDSREWCTRIQLTALRPRAAQCSESRLDIAKRVLRPRTLADMADSEALHQLQQKLLSGIGSRFDQPRSPMTVKSYMTAVITALKWAEYMSWLPSVPKVRKVKTAKVRQMKGRPITGEEFECMLKATREVVGREAAKSWRFVLRGLWESGLRLRELMHVHWTDRESIVPDWTAGAHPVLSIPASIRKTPSKKLSQCSRDRKHFLVGHAKTLE